MLPVAVPLEVANTADTDRPLGADSDTVKVAVVAAPSPSATLKSAIASEGTGSLSRIRPWAARSPTETLTGSDSWS